MYRMSFDRSRQDSIWSKPVQCFWTACRKFTGLRLQHGVEIIGPDMECKSARSLAYIPSTNGARHSHAIRRDFRSRRSQIRGRLSPLVAMSLCLLAPSGSL